MSSDWLGKAKDEALDELLAEAGGREESILKIQEVFDELEILSFPGLLAFLTGASQDERSGRPSYNPATGKRFVQDLMEAAEQAGAGDKFDVDLPELKRLINNSLMTFSSSKGDAMESGESKALQEKILEYGIKALSDRGRIPAVTPEEAGQIAELLRSGEFFQDIGASVAAILRHTQGVPIVFFSDVKQSPHRVVPMLLALARDFERFPDLLQRAWDDVSEDGELDGDYGDIILVNTLRTFYSFKLTSATARTIQLLLERKSVRLAIIIYARSQGLDVTEQDLLDLKDTIFNPSNPTAGKAFIIAFQRLGGEDCGKVLRVLRRMRGTLDRSNKTRINF